MKISIGIELRRAEYYAALWTGRSTLYRIVYEDSGDFMQAMAKPLVIILTGAKGHRQMSIRGK